MKNMLSVITITAASLGFSFVTFAHQSNFGVARTIMQVKNATVISPNVAASTIDFGHVKMKNTRSSPNSASIYNQQDADKLDQDAREYILGLTGLDITTAVPNAFGIPAITNSAGQEIAWVVPFSIGGDDLYRVLYDSENSNKKDGKWTIRNNSIIVQFKRVGTFPAGSTLAGQLYQVNDVISYGYTDHLKMDSEWNNDSKREQFLVYTTRPGAGVTNSLGKSEFHVPLKYIPMDPKKKDPSVGYGSDNTYVEVTGPAGAGQATRSITHHVITFFDEDNQ